MGYSTVRKDQEISAEGVVYDKGSVYDRLHKLHDIRKPRGKRYSLAGLLMIILLAKVCGADKPTEIADWEKNHQEELRTLLKWKRPKAPNESAYRRVMPYNQKGAQGKIYALDGKGLRGCVKKMNWGWNIY